jgi:hypothetical protein
VYARVYVGYIGDALEFPYATAFLDLGRLLLFTLPQHCIDPDVPGDVQPLSRCLARYGMGGAFLSCNINIFFLGGGPREQCGVEPFLPVFVPGINNRTSWLAHKSIVGC